MSKKKPRTPRAGPSPPSSGDKPRKIVTRIEDRIPVMTDADLKALQANAERLVASGTDDQRMEAQQILPVIAAEVGARAKAKAEALKARRAEKSRPNRVQ
jgi:hypothetical protein